MNPWAELAETAPQKEWNPIGEMGKALKQNEPSEARLADLIRKGHGPHAIYRAWGFEGEQDFPAFERALRGLREFMKREGSL